VVFNAFCTKTFLTFSTPNFRIGKIRQNRETNSSSVKEQKRIIQDEIQELRTKVNNHLDKLQEDLMKELTEAENQVTEESRELLASSTRTTATSGIPL
jgi:uncharacterized coiled-coil DUF342 family protein